MYCTVMYCTAINVEIAPSMILDLPPFNEHPFLFYLQGDRDALTWDTLKPDSLVAS